MDILDKSLDLSITFLLQTVFGMFLLLLVSYYIGLQDAIVNVLLEIPIFDDRIAKIVLYFFFAATSGLLVHLSTPP
jgi:type II secretory pathway component PulF